MVGADETTELWQPPTHTFYFIHSLGNKLFASGLLFLGLTTINLLQYQIGHGALQQMEMNNWIGPIVKRVRNNAMRVLHNIWGGLTHTTAFRLGQISLHLLILKSSLDRFLYYLARIPSQLRQEQFIADCFKHNGLAFHFWIAILKSKTT